MHTYRLGITGLDEAVPAGTNLMLIGPPMSGKDAVFNSIVAGGLASGEMVILLSTTETGESIRGRFRNPENLNIIDCMSRPLGLEMADTRGIKLVSGPMDLTGIGVSVGQLLDEARSKGLTRIRLCINSISTLLMYSSLQAVFRFMHVLIGRITVSGALGVYVVEEGMHDQKTLATLMQLINAIIEVKVEDDTYHMRFIGPGTAHGKWLQFDERHGMAVIRGSINDQ